MADPNKTISWQASEFKYYPKSVGWYATLISVAVLIIAFFIIFQRDIFAAVSLGLIAILIALFSKHTPNKINIELNSKGVKFGQLFYPYKQLKYFWVVHNEHHQTINFHTSALVNNILILELEEQDPEITRIYLLQFLPEHKETEPTVVQKIMHRFKF